MIIVKRIEASWSYYTYHAGNGKNLYLNNTDTPVTNSDRWNDTTPTNQVFSLGSGGGTNASGVTMIAYCFAEKLRYCKIGKYWGNGDTSTEHLFIQALLRPLYYIKIFRKRMNGLLKIIKHLAITQLTLCFGI